MKAVTHRIAAVLLTVIGGTSCHAPIVQPGAPGSASRTIARDQAVDLSSVQYSVADVKFMQGMIHHHAQALDMTALLATHTASDDLRKLALRIELSQQDEIQLMRQWLQGRGQEAPDEHAHHMPGATLMPGMLTPEEMDRLAGAKEMAFDLLFLEFMIRHHAGAVVMVDELFAQAGAGQESEVFAFASDVVADQRAEIDRMGIMLQELQR